MKTWGSRRKPLFRFQTQSLCIRIVRVFLFVDSVLSAIRTIFDEDFHFRSLRLSRVHFNRILTRTNICTSHKDISSNRLLRNEIHSLSCLYSITALCEEGVPTACSLAFKSRGADVQRFKLLSVFEWNSDSSKETIRSSISLSRIPLCSGN